MRDIFEFISQESAQSANKVVIEIAYAVEKAIANPEIYRPDKYKIENDGTYRAFELHHYRVSYRYKDNVIRVLAVRHTSRNPKLH